MVRGSIFRTNAKRIVFALIVIAVGIEQYQWWVVTETTFPASIIEPILAENSPRLVRGRETYKEVLNRSPFTLNVPVENIDIAIKAYGSVKYSDETKLLVRFGDNTPSRLLNVGEEYLGWTILDFDTHTAELRGPEGVITIQIKPDVHKRNAKDPSQDTHKEDREDLTVLEVEEIINADT